MHRTMHTPALPSDAPGRFMVASDGQRYRLVALYQRSIPGFGRLTFALWAACDDGAL